MAKTELDYMEYDNDAAAQAAYVSSDIRGEYSVNGDTKLLIHFNGADGATTHTAETGQTVTFVGNAQLDTEYKRFGTASLLLDGSSKVHVPDSDDWYFDGDLTIDCWIRMNNKLESNVIFNQGVMYFQFYFRLSSAGKLSIFKGSSIGNYWAIEQDDASTWNIGQWYHVAIVRSGSTWYMFQDGVLLPSTLTTGGSPVNYNSGYPFNIGWLDGTPDQWFDGWIDEFRVTKGVARWTSSFELDNLQSYSESTIKEQGLYSLKGIAVQTDSLNDTLTRTVDPTIDLTDLTQIKFDIRGSRTGSHIKIGIHDSGGMITEHTANIAQANVWQTETWNISGVSNANKDAIDSIIITIVNADATNTFYVDNMYGTVIGSSIWFGSNF